MTKEINTQKFIAVLKQLMEEDCLIPNDQLCLDNDSAVFHQLNYSIRVPLESKLKCCVSIQEIQNALALVENPTFQQVSKGSIKISNHTDEISITAESDDKFRELFLTYNGSYNDIGTVNAHVISELKIGTSFVSQDGDDSLLTTVFLKDYVVATDKKKWFFSPVGDPLKDSIQLPKAIINIMAIYGGNWRVGKVSTSYYLNMIKLISDQGIEINYKYDLTRKFPDFKKALPKGKLSNVKFEKAHMMNVIKKGMTIVPYLKKTGKISLNGVAHYSVRNNNNKQVKTEFQAEYDDKKVVRFDFPELLLVLESLETDTVVMRIGDSKTMLLNDKFILKCKDVKAYPALEP